MNGLILTFVVLCQTNQPIVFVDDNMKCIAVCDGAGYSHGCFINGKSTTPCFEDNGDTALCDAKWLTISLIQE
jgi:hypothetical protein